jgi:molybdate transport system substrate-binding protein
MTEAVCVRILSAGAPKTGVRLCAEAYTAASGIAHAIEFATGPVIKERVTAGKAGADLVVAPAPAMEGFAEAEMIAADSVFRIGSVTAGVTVRNGAEDPDISSLDAFRQALLDAEALVYNQASSGQYIATMVDKIGIADQVADKTVRVPNGAAVMEFIAADQRQRVIGFGQITEIRLHEDLGVHLVGPLPEEVGKVTTYSAGLSATAENTEAANALLAFMASEEGQQIFAGTGVE